MRLRSWPTLLLMTAMSISGCSGSSGTGATTGDSTPSSSPIASTTSFDLSSTEITTVETTTAATHATTSTIATTVTTRASVDPATELPPITVVDPRPISLAELITVEQLKLNGFQDLAIAAEAPGAFGTFTIAVPQGWIWWVAGADPAPLIEIAAATDPAFSRIVEEGLAEANADIEPGSGYVARFRAYFVDNDSPFYLAGTVVLNDATDLTFDMVRFDARQLAVDMGGEVLRLDAFPGPGGGSIELSVRFDLPAMGWAEPIVQHTSYVFDEANQWVWGVVCTVHESAAIESDELCWTMIRSFRPYGYLTD